ncbi:PDZ domain-containing protein [Photobacterium gaetbulicola]|uniref:PDZ domain-containing protein n=1 Tax=Photobacterium gaetbulicola TaxID=1295392 RepID=UPI0005CC0A7F|nr:PDZ domain-containing protein [Photobacterium gaetbulicola]PSU13136.1 PDZ domain-containing protein [Photobacterium gaetbulicola]
MLIRLIHITLFLLLFFCGSVHATLPDVITDEKKVYENILRGDYNSAVICPDIAPALLDGIQLENTINEAGIRVLGVAPNSKAAFSGIRQGDIIFTVNRKKVNDIRSLESFITGKDSVSMNVFRGGRLQFIVLQ